jgi:hypothetical protein
MGARRGTGRELGRDPRLKHRVAGERRDRPLEAVVEHVDVGRELVAELGLLARRAPQQLPGAAPRERLVAEQDVPVVALVFQVSRDLVVDRVQLASGSRQLLGARLGDDAVERAELVDPEEQRMHRQTVTPRARVEHALAGREDAIEEDATLRARRAARRVLLPDGHREGVPEPQAPVEHDRIVRELLERPPRELMVTLLGETPPGGVVVGLGQQGVGHG